MSQNMPLLSRVLGTAAPASVIMTLLMSYQWSGAAEPPTAKIRGSRRRSRERGQAPPSPAASSSTAAAKASPDCQTAAVLVASGVASEVQGRSRHPR